MPAAFAIARPNPRKSTGAYYTPAPLINLLLSHALPHNPIHPLKILDPACGQGDFLCSAQHRLHPAPCRLFGVDINPAAVAQANSALSCNNINPNHFQIQTADALLNPPDFLQPQSFDLILGNPPYVNAIEGNLSASIKSRLRERFPDVRGAADLAHYFLAQAIDLVRPGGKIALVLPRAILNSPAAKNLRAHLPEHLRPNLIYAPERHDFFPGAAVFICLLILGPDPVCKVSTNPNPAAAGFRTATIDTDNWWLALQPPVEPPPTAGPTLGDHFEVRASMIAADAYDLLPHLIDDESAQGPKLVTTGLIEPNACLWGQRPCRYLKKDYQHPRLDLSNPLTRSLAKRIATARRPKILIAGLAKKIEAFLDPTGQFIGAVSTFSIHHPADDTAALSTLLKKLLSPVTTNHFVNHLGANALRGQHVTLKKTFLRTLPIE
jgi:SAM-dependent methyltransferase